MDSVRSHLEVLDSTPWHNQTVLVFEVDAARGCALDDLSRKCHVFRMHALENHVQGWLLAPVVFENAVSLV